MTPRLLERYRKEVVPKLSQEFGYENRHQVPTLSKIVVNVGLGPGKPPVGSQSEPVISAGGSDQTTVSAPSVDGSNNVSISPLVTIGVFSDMITFSTDENTALEILENIERGIRYCYHLLENIYVFCLAVLYIRESVIVLRIIHTYK